MCSTTGGGREQEGKSNKQTNKAFTIRQNQPQAHREALKQEENQTNKQISNPPNSTTGTS
jgi:hypothetical protein